MSRGKVIIFTGSGAIAATIAALATAGISPDAVVVADDPAVLQDTTIQSTEDMLLEAAQSFQLDCQAWVDEWEILSIEPEEHDTEGPQTLLELLIEENREQAKAYPSGFT